MRLFLAQVILVGLWTIPQVNLLLDAGAEVNTADEEGQTPLLRVSEYGKPAETTKVESALIAQQLLDKGADVNVTDLEGDTAAILATRAANWLVQYPSSRS